DGLDHPVVVRAQVLLHVQAREPLLAELGEVLPRAEPTALAGDDHAPDLRIRRAGLDRVDGLLGELVGQRVEFVGTVETDPPHAVLRFEQDLLVPHRLASRLAGTVAWHEPSRRGAYATEHGHRHRPTRGGPR